MKATKGYPWLKRPPRSRGGPRTRTNHGYRLAPVGWCRDKTKCNHCSKR